MKTLLLGLDGLDPDLVEEFDLPNIESVGDGFEIDTHGNSGPSWVSVMTGRTPKHHGVQKLRPQQDEQSWAGTPIWEKVDGYSGIANVPLTYPPDTDIDGWMVTGLMTPQRAIYTAPRHLYQELDDLGYRIDMWVDQHQNHPNGHFGTTPFEFTQEYRDELLEELEVVLEKRGDGFMYLLENEPVDFAFLCFTTLDRVQHLAFDDRGIVRWFYGLLDDQVGRILEWIPPETEVYLTSDHGFRRYEVPNSDITGEHRVEGYGATSTGQEFKNLEELHELVVESANRTDVRQRLSDLGYLD